MEADERWLRLSERKLNLKRAKKLLKYWMKVLGTGDYAFKIRLTKGKWRGSLEFKVGVHYGIIECSTERTLLHELLEAMLWRYKSISGAKDETDNEYLVRHILLFQLVNALLRLRYPKEGSRRLNR